MRHLLDYEHSPAGSGIKVGAWTWVLSAATSIAWLGSMVTISVGDFSGGAGALIVPGFVLACVMFPWWPTNVLLALAPLTLWVAASKGPEAAVGLLRASKVSLVSSLLTLLAIAVALRLLDPRSHGLAIPLWLASHTLGCLAIARLARTDAYRRV